MWVTSLITKSAQNSKHPTGENSLNLVTLQLTFKTAQI
jgi:hypothetical protein